MYTFSTIDLWSREEKKHFMFTSANEYELREYGYTIVKGVVDLDQVSATKQAIDDWLVSVCDVPREEIGQRAGKKPTNWPYTLHGIFKHYGVAHLQALWDLRQNDDVIRTCVDAYAANGVEIDPIVSFDGVCVMPSYSRASISRMRSCLHLDQTKKSCLTAKNSKFTGSPHDFQSIQGLIPLVDMSPATGTFRVLAKSHLHHEKVCDMHADSFFNINDDAYTYLIENGCDDVSITASAGDYVLWDSRAVHAAVVPTQPKNDWRYVAYITYGDRRRTRPGQLRKREKAFADLRMTGHWTEIPKLNPKTPRSTYSARDIPYLSTSPLVTKRHLIA